MKTAQSTSDATERKLDDIIGLLQHLLALELARNGVAKDKIGKHLHVAKSAVVKMLQGAKKENHAHV